MCKIMKLNHPAQLLLTIILSAWLVTGCSTGLFTFATATDTQEPPLVTASPEIIAEGHLTPKDSVSLGFQAGGKVVEIMVDEGDQVTRGTVLARLGDREQMEASLSAAELELLDAQQDLDDLNEKAALARGQAYQALVTGQRALINAQERLDEIDTQEYQDRIDDAQEEVITAEDDLRDAQDEMDKYQDLDPDNAFRKRAEDELEDAQKNYDQALRKHDLLQNDLDQARASVELAQAQVDDVQRTYDACKDGPDPDDLALAEARLNNAQRQLAAAQSALENLDLIAPFDGTIVDLDVSLNEEVTPRQPVILLADLSEWYVETSDLTEMDVVDIETGQSAWVVADAIPGVELKAVVDSIPNVSKQQAGDIVYEVRLRLEQTDPKLRWGMTVEVRFVR